LSNQVTIEKVSKSFSRKGADLLPVLQDISFKASAGTIISILGKSGIGKTTLLNIVSQLELPNSGRVDATGVVGYVPQRDLLLPWRTVLRNVLLPIEIKRTVGKNDITEAENLLRHAGLEKFKDAFPSEISGGMRQRVSLIRTFMQNPDIVLFDEPFAAIDFDARLKLGREVRSQIVSQHKIGIFVTHNIEEAISMGDEILILAGRPARIVHKEEVKIDEQFRDPTSIRKTKDFQNHFDTLWHLLSKES
jgi:NitT/TauT family transport system ATP-binding protein